LVTDRRQARKPLAEIVAAALAAGCRWVSVREKDLPDDEQIALARMLLPITRRNGACLTLHGAADLAKAAGADGVHLSAGGDVAASRQLLGADKLIGVSIHTATEAAAIDPAVADYAIAGPAYETASKPGYGPEIGRKGLADLARSSPVPLVAIGGLNAMRIRSHLPATLLMPVDRRDLLDLLGTQDSIAGAAQDVASLLALGRLRVPAAMDAQLMPFVQRVVDSVVTCTTAIDTLDELLETGFGRREGDKVLAIAQQIDGIETETDTMGMELVRKLIEHEKDTDVLSVVFWYRLLQSLGNIADEAENVGDRLRVLLAR
jgi:thiamine-phosphate pyrophosphorylase